MPLVVRPRSADSRFVRDASGLRFLDDLDRAGGDLIREGLRGSASRSLQRAGKDDKDENGNDQPRQSQADSPLLIRRLSIVSARGLRGKEDRGAGASKSRLNRNVKWDCFFSREAHASHENSLDLGGEGCWR